MGLIQSDWKPSPLYSALALGLLSLIAYGGFFACSPGVGESDISGEDSTKTPSKANTETPVRFELRLASREAVDGWQPHEIAAHELVIFVSPEVAVTNTDVARAWHSKSGEKYVVGLYFSEEGALKLAELTTQHVGEIVAIMIDGQVVSAPIIAGRLNERAEIRSNFTEAEARNLAAALNPAR